jgi:hypothetical protein
VANIRRRRSALSWSSPITQTQTQRLYKGNTRVLQGCSKSVTRLSQGLTLGAASVCTVRVSPTAAPVSSYITKVTVRSLCCCWLRLTTWANQKLCYVILRYITLYHVICVMLYMLSRCEIPLLLLASTHHLGEPKVMLRSEMLCMSKFTVRSFWCCRLRLTTWTNRRYVMVWCCMHPEAHCDNPLLLLPRLTT